LADDGGSKRDQAIIINHQSPNHQPSPRNPQIQSTWYKEEEDTHTKTLLSKIHPND